MRRHSTLAVPLSFVAAAAVVVACGSSSRSSFPDPGANGTGEGGVPNFGDEKKDAGPAPSCATAEAAAIKPPVDFIFSIDQSGSMSEESALLVNNINTLSTLLQKSGLDYRLVMIAGTTGFAAVCVPPPLGGPNCSSNGNIFRAVNQHLESTDTFKWIIDTFKLTGGDKAWADFLRPDALKVFVPITDDKSDMPAATFDAQLLSLGGTLFGNDQKRNYVMYPIIGANAFPLETKCPTAVNNGPEYLQVAKMTGGKWFPVCTPNFQQVFQEIGLTVNAAVACELAIPTVQGQELDPDRVNVKVKHPDGTTDLVLKDTKDCNAGADGWQYSADGKKIVLCGQACESIKAAPDDKVNVEFGCQTQVK